MSKVVIVGGCGRLGLRLSLTAANKGHNVTAIDIDEERLNEVKQGCMPFVEPKAEIYLEQATKKKTLTLSMEYEPIQNADIVIVTIGTPVDSNLNPSLEPVAGVLFDISQYLKRGQLLIFRNTLSPSIVGRIKILLEDKTGFKIGKDIYLAFAPELTKSDTATINELSSTNQPIGTFEEKSFKAAEEFFKTLTKGKISWLTPEEALLAKLMSNMFTYIQTACANEFYLISESFRGNIHKITDAVNGNELQIPNPNPNGAGPGMHKEGWFLVERIPFSELITTAFKINESIPAHIVQELEGHRINKVAILGMTSKPNSDDASSSLSYKIRKALYYKDYVVGCYDPYLPEFSDSSVLQGADALILMTPHNEFSNLERILKLVNNPNCLIIDINGFWKETREKSLNGLFRYKELNLKGENT